MAIFMSDEELLKGLKELADNGEVILTGWRGFKAVIQQLPSPHSQEDVESAMYWAFWAGARCSLDALHRLGAFQPKDEYVKKIWDELGNDPMCRPPNRSTVQ